jgi:hypothetical protein
VLLEFDADQRLWQETVRDAVGKQCPASLVRSIAEDGTDAEPLWKVLVEAGWTELTDPENAVELAIVLEELGRATDPTPYLATLTQFAPLVGERFDPLGSPSSRPRVCSWSTPPVSRRGACRCSTPFCTSPRCPSSASTSPTPSDYPPTPNAPVTSP